MVGIAQENCKVSARDFMELDDIVKTAQVDGVIVGLTKSGTVRSLVHLTVSDDPNGFVIDDACTKFFGHEKIDGNKGKGIFEGCRGGICSIQARGSILLAMTEEGEAFVCKHAGQGVFWGPDKLDLDHAMVQVALAPAVSNPDDDSTRMMVVT